MRDVSKQRKAQLDWMQRRRAAWFAANGPCQGCGTWESLQVDHIDPKQKVSHNVWSWSAERAAVELAKCQALCTECHKAKTREERRRPIIHGTMTTYKHHGCRCSACREANNARNRRNAERRRAGLPVGVPNVSQIRAE